MQRVFLINPMTIKNLTNISVNMSDKMLDTAIKEAQDTELNEVLGTKLLYRLYDLVATGQISQTENSLYKELLDYHVSYFLVYNAISRLIVIASIKIDNIGVVTTGDEKVNNLPVKDIFALESYYRGKSDFYKSRLQAYLRLHRDDFNELAYHDAYNTLAAIETAYTSSIFLGGRRGKQTHKPCYCKPTQPTKPVELRTINYYVDNVLFTSAKYATGQLIKHVEAPIKENQHFNVWLYEKDGQWLNLPDYMPDFDINAYAHYIWEEGEQWTYQIGFKVAEGYSDADVHFGNMCYINEPFEWLQEVERGYNHETREGWARLTHPSLRFDTAITCQKFVGYDKLETLDLHELNNVSLSDRMFFDCSNLHNFIPPKGLVGMQGYDFYNSNLTSINFKTDYEYTAYQSFAAPMTGSFCFCPNLTAIHADNQPFMYSDNGNLYNMDNGLMATRSGEVVLSDNCTAILSEAIKGRYITTLTIPNSVKKIELYAVADNDELKDVYFNGTIEQWGRIEKGENMFVNTQVYVIHCTDGDCDVYYNTNEPSPENPDEPQRYSVDFYANNEWLEGKDYFEGDEIAYPVPPTFEGYEFKAWEVNNGGNWEPAPSHMPAYSFNAVAKYNKIEPEYHNINYYVNGELYDYQSYQEGETIEAPTAEKEGHTFLGWEGLPIVMPAHDVEVHANFSVNTYTVTFYVDGEEYHKETVAYWDIIPLPHEPSKEGYTFSHWYGDLHYPTRMPSHDIDTYAIFDVNSYKITYVAGDWSEEATYEYGDTINEKTAPVKEGYSFLYWDELPTTMPAKDITVTAIYERNEYKITYMIDGVPYNEARYYFEDEVQPYVPKVDEGYVFNGWDNEPTTMPAHDVVVTGSITKVEEPEDTTDYSTMYMTLEAIEDSEFTFSGTSYSTFVNYSIDDGVTWNKTKGKDAKTSLIPSGGKVLIKATTDDVSRVYVLSSGKFKTYGNILSTQHGDDFIGKEAISSFNVHFYNSTNLVDASNLIFPSTDLTTLSASNIYSSYFNGCTSLVTAPKILPSTSIGSFSYQNMFKGCTSLTTPPVIMATSMKNSSLYSMFEGCTSLTTAPVINVEHIANYGCYRMFKGCSNLTNVTMLFTSYDTGSTSNALYELLDGVASTGTFYKSPNMPLETIQQHVPSGWTILDYAG